VTAHSSCVPRWPYPSRSIILVAEDVVQRGMQRIELLNACRARHVVRVAHEGATFADGDSHPFPNPFRRLSGAPNSVAREAASAAAYWEAETPVQEAMLVASRVRSRSAAMASVASLSKSTLPRREEPAIQVGSRWGTAWI
jgi:hypothetical protein